MIDLRPDELVVDNFAGGGGASLGLEMALMGRKVDIAINHDPIAIAIHKVNHPETLHYCKDVFDVDPAEACGGRPVGIAWFSPDCTHFSKAKGGTPVKKEIRDLAWVVLKWASMPKWQRPRIINLENVEEFKDWGPLVERDGRHYPCPVSKGKEFNRFVKALTRKGYKVEWRTLRACDYGAPTIRKRLFMVARRDGKPIAWPVPTHGDPASEAVKSGRLLPWRTAAECIDWSLPCPSIFERKRPLAENTLRRIARGVMRYVVNNPEPFIVTYYGDKGKGEFRGQPMGEPFRTQTRENRFGMVVPSLIDAAHGEVGKDGAKRWGKGHKDIKAPLSTILASGGGHAIAAASLLKNYGGGYDGDGIAMDDPTGTVTAKDHHSLMAATLVKNNFGTKPAFSPDDPLHTITTQDNKHSVVAATLVQTGYGERNGQAPRAPGLGKPLGTAVAGGAKHALVAAHISKMRTGATGHAMDEPMHTVTAGGKAARPSTGQPLAVVAAHLARHMGKSVGAAADVPARAILLKEKDALVTSHVMKMKGTNIGHGADESFHTLTSGGLHFGEVRAFLIKYYGTDQDPKFREPMHTVPTRDRFGLVTVEGEDYAIADIGMRMLQPHELKLAQGFPESYIIDRDEHGKPITKTAQVAMIGNSVCPDVAAALVTANVHTARMEKTA